MIGYKYNTDNGKVLENTLTFAVANCEQASTQPPTLSEFVLAAASQVNSITEQHGLSVC